MTCPTPDPTPATLDDSVVEPLAAALRGPGWACLQGLLSAPLAAGLSADARRLQGQGRLRPAGIGRAQSHLAQPQLRGDATLWLDDPACGDAARAFLAHMDALRLELNRRLLLGLDALEAHYAHYPAGARYARHRDHFRDDDARVLSIVAYLNPDWPMDAGGALRLYLPEGAHDIAPRLGTCVFFLSAEFEHEVLPASQPRLSIAGWFRRRALTPL